MTHKAKIMFIMGSYTVGGAEKQWAQYLSARPKHLNFDIEVLTFLPPQSASVEKSFSDLGVKISLVDRSSLSFPLFLWQLFLAIRRSKPSIAHTILEGSTGTWGRLIALLAGVPRIMHSDRSTPNPETSIHSRLRPFLNSKTHHFTPNAYAIADWLKATGVPEQTITVMPNVTNVERFNPEATHSLRAVWGIPEEALVAGYMAAFRAEKRIDVLLDALVTLDVSERPDYLVMGGDGDMMPMVKERIAADPWLKEHCKLLGMIEDAPNFFASIDYFCLSSDREGTPNVVLESLAMKKPVVATAIVDLPRLLKKTGFVAEPGNPKAFAQALKRMNNLSSSERQALGECGRQQVLERHELSKAAAIFWQAHEAVLEA